MNRQSWTCDEDQAICKLVGMFGLNDWTKIAEKLKQTYSIAKRTGKQCRERWYNHLNPAVNKKPWDNEQESLLFKLHKAHGNRWKDISRFFTGRTDNDIKNHFYSTLRRSLRRLNKISGQKNSTSQMREIKPSVLSTIMSYIYDQQHTIEKDLLLSLQDLPTLIFEYANFKPIKNNLKNNRWEDSRSKIFQIFQLINKFNQEYQKNKEIKHQQKITKRFHYRKESPDVTCVQESSLNHTYQLEEPFRNKFCSSDTTIKELQENKEMDSDKKHCYDPLEREGQSEQQNEEICEGENEVDGTYLKRNLSLEEQDIQEAQMPSLIGPDRYTFQGQYSGEQQLDLTIIGHRWQPQTWQSQLQMKEFVDEVLQMNYDVV